MTSKVEKMKEEVADNIVHSVILGVLILIGLLALINPPEPNWIPSPFWQDVLINRKKEYLFFIGTTLLSLLLISERRWAAAIGAFAAGILWITFLPSVAYYLRSIGVDSFAEAESFGFEEAKFWLQTVSQVVHQELNFQHLLIYFLFAVAVFFCLRLIFRNVGWSSKRALAGKMTVSFLSIAVACTLTVSEAVKFYLNNSRAFLSVTQNFDNPVPGVTGVPSGTSLIVYIGESTTTMHMELYGYPRQTTPALSQIARTDGNLIQFENVFSTHTHTSPSLLEALSFGIDSQEMYLPIEKRKRISLIDVLNKADVSPILISNQGMVGTWNQAGSVIFRNASSTFSTQSRLFGNSDDRSSKPWDDEFFGYQLAKIEAQHQSGLQAIFLHSYAGHGDYAENIPAAFRSPVDDLLEKSRPYDISISGTFPRKMVEKYDSAVKYIDYSISKSIAHTKALTRPVIFVYFSDHGEAVFSGRAHDSARFSHEMIRIPMLIYFNDAAKTANPALFEKYRALALSQETSTLAQLPSTLLDLLGLSISPQTGRPALMTPFIGEKATHPPIVVRKTTAGTTFVNLNESTLNPETAEAFNLIDASDELTKAYVRYRTDPQFASRLCGSRLLSLEAVRRRDLTGACL